MVPVPSIFRRDKGLGYKAVHFIITENNPVLLVDGIYNLAMAIKKCGGHQGFIIIHTADIGNVQRKKPGETCSDTDGDNAADDKQERDYIIMVPGFSSAYRLSGRFFRRCFFSGCHETGR